MLRAPASPKWSLADRAQVWVPRRLYRRKLLSLGHLLFRCHVERLLNWNRPRRAARASGTQCTKLRGSIRGSGYANTGVAGAPRVLALRPAFLEGSQFPGGEIFPWRRAGGRRQAFAPRRAQSLRQCLSQPDYSASGQARHFAGQGSWVSADAAVATKAAARTLSRSASLRPGRASSASPQ